MNRPARKINPMSLSVKKVLPGLLATLVVCGVLGGAVQWACVGRFREATDNAYVAGDITAIAPKVAGYVVDVSIGDNQEVRAGDVLFKIDDADYRAKRASAQASVALARADLVNLEAEQRLQDALIDQAKAQVESSQAALILADQTHRRISALVESSAASRSRVEETQAALSQAKASVTAAQAALSAESRRLEVLASRKDAAQAGLERAQAALDLAQIDLENTVVRAPVDGVIGNRQVRLGRYVTPGASLLQIVPVDGVWVVANFKETQIRDMQIGQVVQITVDGYPQTDITGRIDSLAPATGSAFSLIPADNATGNFVRIVQRVPVRITLVTNPLPGRLVPGLSARVKVHLDDTSGPGADPMMTSLLYR